MPYIHENATKYYTHPNARKPLPKAKGTLPALPKEVGRVAESGRDGKQISQSPAIKPSPQTDEWKPEDHRDPATGETSSAFEANLPPDTQGRNIDSMPMEAFPAGKFHDEMEEPEGYEEPEAKMI